MSYLSRALGLSASPRDTLGVGIQGHQGFPLVVTLFDHRLGEGLVLGLVVEREFVGRFA